MLRRRHPPPSNKRSIEAAEIVLPWDNRFNEFNHQKSERKDSFTTPCSVLTDTDCLRGRQRFVTHPLLTLPTNTTFHHHHLIFSILSHSSKSTSPTKLNVEHSKHIAARIELPTFWLDNLKSSLQASPFYLFFLLFLHLNKAFEPWTTK